MTLAPRPSSAMRRSIFSDSGEDIGKLSLISAVYFDRTKRALAIIEADPEQINVPDPFAGLTALHVAIFRQNVEIVERMAEHPATRFDLNDRFGRRAIDMCAYTKNDAIFHAVLTHSYTLADHQLNAGDLKSVVAFRPLA